MANIGNLNAKITADASQFIKESERATATVERQVKSMKKQVATMGMSKNETAIWTQQMRGADAATVAKAKSLARQIELTQKYQAVTAKASMALKVFAAAAVAAAVAGVAMLTKKSFEQIDVLGETAARLGISTEALAGFQYAANQADMDVSTLDKSLQKMVINVAKAAQGSGEAQDEIRRLGLDAKALASMTPDEMLKRFADGLQGVSNHTEKVAIATAIFGKEGAKMLAVLAGGSAGLNASAEAAAKIGTALSGIDVAKVKAANDAFGRLGMVLQGIGNQIAVGIAPYVEELSNRFVSLATTGDGVAGKVNGAMESVARGVAYVADVAQLPIAAFHKLTQIVAKQAQGWVGILKAFVRVYDRFMVEVLGQPTSGLTSALGDAFKELGNSAAESGKKASDAWDSFMAGGASKSVAAYFDDVKNKANDAAMVAADAVKATGGAAFGDGVADGMDKIADHARTADDVIQELAEQLATINMDGDQKTLRDMENMGASDEQIAKAKQLMEQTKGLRQSQDDFNRMTGDAARVMADVATPAEKYAAELKNLDELLSKGYISQETYARAAAKAAGETEKQADSNDRLKQSMDAITGTRFGLAMARNRGGRLGGVFDAIDAGQAAPTAPGIPQNKTNPLIADGKGASAQTIRIESFDMAVQLLTAISANTKANTIGLLAN